MPTGRLDDIKFDIKLDGTRCGTIGIIWLWHSPDITYLYNLDSPYLYVLTWILDWKKMFYKIAIGYNNLLKSKLFTRVFYVGIKHITVDGENMTQLTPAKVHRGARKSDLSWRFDTFLVQGRLKSKGLLITDHTDRNVRSRQIVIHNVLRLMFVVRQLFVVGLYRIKSDDRIE